MKKENEIIEEILKECNCYERIIIKIFKKLFIKCYNVQRIKMTNIFLN